MSKQLKIGTEVRTWEAREVLNHLGRSEEELASRRWDITGIVIAAHDAHGLLYEIQHDDDGSFGHYEPYQLISMAPVKVDLFEHQARMLLKLHGLAQHEGAEGLPEDMVFTLETAFPHLIRSNYFRDL